MKICLSMIVKDESHVILDCLKAVMPGVDEAIIHDTGSTDRTDDIIENYASEHDLSISVANVPWQDFSYNRNKCLEQVYALSSSDYVLVMDADDKPVVTDKHWRKQLDKFDVYNVEIRLGDTTYHRPILFRNQLGRFKFKGAVHEYLDIPADVTVGNLEGVYIEASHKGARSKDPDKYAKDSFLLLKELRIEPDNPRAQFYLARSYHCLGDKGAAMNAYGIRANNEKGWIQERWYSLYQIARITNEDSDYLNAYSRNGTRAEPLYHMAMKRDLRDPCALMFLAMAALLQKPRFDNLFVENSVYDYLISIAYATAAFYAGNPQISKKTNQALLANPKLPPEQRKIVEANLAFCC